MVKEWDVFEREVDVFFGVGIVSEIFGVLDYFVVFRIVVVWGRGYYEKFIMV